MVNGEMVTLFSAALDRFQDSRWLADTLAEAVAITLVEVQKASGTVEEYGRVWQTADEICVAMEWPFQDFATLINYHVEDINS